MSEENKRNLLYFEASTMRGLFADMDAWQAKNRKRLLSVSVQRDGDAFSCIALTNPTEVIIVDGSTAGGAAVNKVQNINHLATCQQKCFPATARVLTATGPRPIADVEPGDLVISYRPDGTTCVRPVTRKLAHGECTIHRVVLDRGVALRATANHRVLTTRGWLKVRDLHPGDEVVRPEDRSVVVEVQAEPKPEPVYNLYTAGEHTFVVEGVVVHNFTHLRVLRTWMHRLLVDPLVSAPAPPERLSANPA